MREKKRKKRHRYMSKDFVALACSDVFEDILKRTFDEEEPAAHAPTKHSKSTQTSRGNYLVHSRNVKKRRFKNAIDKIYFKVGSATDFIMRNIKNLVVKMQDRGVNSCFESKYMTKEFLAKACSDFFEDILRKTFDEEDPVSQAPIKCTQETQTGAYPQPVSPAIEN